MYFPSEKDIWAKIFFYGFLMFIFLIYSFGSEPFGLQFITYNSLFGYIITGGLLGILIWIWFRTGYYVGDGKLKIKYGPFRWTIESKDIKKISKEKSPFTAPSLSMDRLSILYGNYKEISISPINKKELIRILTAENPHIVVED
ncbi:PH domain-containing protein [Alkalihalobacterium elongatum]|uniref:PH domain-containing protein n=1 Tax=Alkalihalobacterium elongatum TaxID=2675466 RepID=UPI001C1F355E|nr:PH domain-containing protein [Alkalihalobacterium elongatum]